MVGGTRRRGSWRRPVPQELLPRWLRLPTAVLLVACVALTALAVQFAGRGQSGWLDSAIDPRIQAGFSRFPVLLSWLPDVGTLRPVALITLALVLACTAIRRWSGAVLAAVAVPAAIGLTEYVLKPYFGRVIGQSLPSGHATSMFALAAICAVLLVDPPGRRVPVVVRSLLVLVALMLAAAVAAAMVATGAHDFTDAVAGAAVGTGLVLACALTLDLVISRARGARAPRCHPGGDQQQAVRAPSPLPETLITEPFSTPTSSKPYLRCPRQSHSLTRQIASRTR
jgi:membrane-associated phospholipid phosphatase